jgi:hypothetical protein
LLRCVTVDACATIGAMRSADERNDRHRRLLL